MTVFVISDNIAFDVDRGTIFLEKSSLSEDDRIAMLFAETLNELGVRYSVIAGYVAILFGRARRSDDIDFITYPLAEGEFLKFCFY
jgi:predicted nucleotidyltransferase